MVLYYLQDLLFNFHCDPNLGIKANSVSTFTIRGPIILEISAFGSHLIEEGWEHQIILTPVLTLARLFFTVISKFSGSKMAANFTLFFIYCQFTLKLGIRTTFVKLLTKGVKLSCFRFIETECIHICGSMVKLGLLSYVI